MNDEPSVTARTTRNPIELELRYSLEGDRQWRSGVTVDLSDSGVLFHAVEPLVPGTPLEMTVDLPAALGRLPSGVLRCSARVVRQAFAPSSIRRYPLAITFVDVRSSGQRLGARLS